MTAIVQRLTAGEGAGLLRHLYELPAEDRALRFGAAANDSTVERYVGSIDFARDAVFGVFQPGHELVGAAHLALCRDAASAELGLSVAREARGRGYGYALLRIAAAHAAKLRFRRLYTHCLTENRVMIHLARKAGMTVVRGSSESDAHLALQPCLEEGAPQRGRPLLEWLGIMRGAWSQPR